MNGNSKRERVDAMIRRAVRDQIFEMCFRDQALRECLASNSRAEHIGIGAAYNVSGDPYRMKELADIINWKKQPKSL